MEDWVLVHYSTGEIETFFVSEFEERNKKRKRFRVLRSVVLYIPLILKFLV